MGTLLPNFTRGQTASHISHFMVVNEAEWAQYGNAKQNIAKISRFFLLNLEFEKCLGGQTER